MGELSGTGDGRRGLSAAHPGSSAGRRDRTPVRDAGVHAPLPRSPLTLRGLRGRRRSVRAGYRLSAPGAGLPRGLIHPSRWRTLGPMLVSSPYGPFDKMTMVPSAELVTFIHAHLDRLRAEHGAEAVARV